jgi:predicted DNA-binding protein
MCYSKRINLIYSEAGMSTTTIRLPEDLKARIAEAAKRTGKTTHSYILEAITKKAEQDEQRADFDAAAEDRYARIVATGKTIPWQEMRGYLEDRLVGKKVKRPIARKLVR